VQPTWTPTAQAWVVIKFQDLIPDVQARCGLDEKIGEFAIVRRNALLSLDAV
jgi:hypothetical protein